MSGEPLPSEHLSPLATLVDEVLAGVGYKMAVATELIDDAVPGYDSLLDPATTPAEFRQALEDFLSSDRSRLSVPEPTDRSFVLYVGGSSRSPRRISGGEQHHGVRRSPTWPLQTIARYEPQNVAV